MPYFAIANGLRGCYLPDSSYVIQCGTRRELKAALAWKARRGTSGEFVAPYRWQYQARGSFPFGLFVWPSDKETYLQESE